MSETQRVPDSDGVWTLKHLALAGALEGETKLSCADLAGRLDASTPTASRRLQELESAGYLDRDIVSDGQGREINGEGEQLLQVDYAS
mgnify:CR=1 FL=1